MLGADYEYAIPGAALEQLGIGIVFRYVGLGSSSKWLTVAEYNDLLKYNIVVHGVAESTANEADNGYNAGVADAHRTLAAFDLPFYWCTNDQNVWSQKDVDYARGFCATVGTTSGVYGYAPYLIACHDQNIGHGYWQCGHTPTVEGTSDFVNVWQRQGSDGQQPTFTVAGIQADYNQVYSIPLGDDVNANDVVNALMSTPVKYENRDGKQVSVPFSDALARVCLLFDDYQWGAAGQRTDGPVATVFRQEATKDGATVPKSLQ